VDTVVAVHPSAIARRIAIATTVVGTLATTTSKDVDMVRR